MNQPATPGERLAPPTMLYRFAVECRRFGGQWKPGQGVALLPKHRIPVFSQLDERPVFAEVRAGWAEAGLFVMIEVRGKQQSIWCRPTRLLESDGLQLWIDTRDTHNIHRASRFCHWFVCLPGGGGSRRDEPLASMLKINRARDFPRTFGSAAPQVATRMYRDGYRLAVLVPAASLDGWNPAEHRKLGFSYAIADRELGWQTLATGPEFPVAEDPALWHTLELVD